MPSLLENATEKAPSLSREKREGEETTYLIPHRVHVVLDDFGSLLHPCERHREGVRDRPRPAPPLERGSLSDTPCSSSAKET